MRHKFKQKSVAEYVIAYSSYYLAAKNPFISGNSRVVIIDCTAAWIKAIKAISRGLIGAIGYGLIELAIIKTGKSTLLVYHARYSIRKRRMLYPVHNNGAYRYLTDVTFSSSLGRYKTGQKIIIGRGIST